MKVSKAERQEAIDRLRAMLRPGDTLACTVKHVSASGMYRAIDVRKIYVPARLADRARARHNGADVLWLSYLIAKAGIGRWDDKREAVGMSGCGMDMCFAIVYELSRTLWPEGYECAGRERCRSNDHSNPGPARDAYGKGNWHDDGGYALRCEGI